MSGRWHPGTVGESIRAELDRFGPAGAIADVVAAWPEAVGPAIAENAWPARIARDGTLVVAASSSVWAFELSQLEASIRERLAAAIPDAPGRLRFMPGRLPERGAKPHAEAVRAVPQPVAAEALAAGEHVAAGIADADLRALVARAAAFSLARAAGRPDDRPL